MIKENLREIKNPRAPIVDIRKVVEEGQRRSLNNYRILD